MSNGKVRMKETQCKFVDANGGQCNHLAHCKGWCKPHYEQQRRGFPLQPLLETEPRICEYVDADGVKCDREVFNVRRHLCQLHYEHWRRGALGGYQRQCVNCDVEFTAFRGDKYTCSDKCSYENSQLKLKYKITGSELNVMLKAQEYKCHTCKHPISRGGDENSRQLHVDHDHACCPGQTCCGRCLRKLLCGPCNIAAGLMGESPEVAYAIGDYLKEYDAKHVERLGQGELLDFSENTSPEVGLPFVVEGVAEAQA